MSYFFPFGEAEKAADGNNSLTPFILAGSNEITKVRLRK